jgi:hypothetical protein
VLTTVKHVHGCSAKSVTPVIVIIALILGTAYGGEIGALRLDETRILGVSSRLCQVSKRTAGSSDKLGKNRKSAPMLSIEQPVCDLGDVGVGSGNLCEFRFGNAVAYLRSNQGLS